MAKGTLTVLAGTETGLIKGTFFPHFLLYWKDKTDLLLNSELSFPASPSRDRQNNLIPKIADQIKSTVIGQVNAEAAIQKLAYVHKTENTFHAKEDKLAAARKNGSIDIYRYDEERSGWKVEECLEGFEGTFVHLSGHQQ